MSWQFGRSFSGGFSVAALGKGGVTPLSILGNLLPAWWTADRADLITLAGSAITSWRDVVGGYDAAQAFSASRPTYSATSFNGAPSATLDSNDDFLSATLPGTFPVGASAGEIWAIIQQDALTADSNVRHVLCYGDATNNASRRLARQTQSSANIAAAYVGTGGASAVKGTPPASPLSSRHVLRQVISPTGVDLWLDGVRSNSGGTGETAGVPATAASGFIRIGVGPAGTTGFWHGKIRDLLIISGVPSAAQLAALNAWALPRRML